MAHTNVYQCCHCMPLLATQIVARYKRQTAKWKTSRVQQTNTSTTTYDRKPEVIAMKIDEKTKLQNYQCATHCQLLNQCAPRLCQESRDLKDHLVLLRELCHTEPLSESRKVYMASGGDTTLLTLNSPVIICNEYCKVRR